VGEVTAIAQLCFAMETQGSARHLLGNNDEPRGIEMRALTSCDVSSLVIDTLCERAGGQNVAVACFYFDFAVQQEQSSTSVLGALLKQLAVGLGELPEEMVQAYEEQINFIGGRRLEHTDTVKMLQTASSKKRTFICIDALDECVPEHRVQLLNSLNKILQKSPNIRLFVTGRPHIRPEIEKRLSGRVTSLLISTKRDDIIRYLHSRLEDDTTPDVMNSSLEAEILKKIPEDVSEMYVRKLGEYTLSYVKHGLTDSSRFLLVSLNIDAVLQETTIHRRRQKLSAMANGLGLGGAYSATLGRITGQGMEKARLGLAALMWISHAERPLKADELCHALAVEIGSPNLNTDNVPLISTILACCQGLVVVGKEASTVRLIHFTLQEYLRAHPEIFGPAHSTMAGACLSYLNSQQVKALSTSPSPSLHNTLFLEYSSLYWGVHARRDLSDCAKQLALKLFDDHSNHIPTKILLQAQRDYIHAFDFDKISLFSDLHYASFFGIIEIVASLIAMESCDINKQDCGGNTSLAWASRNGHEGVVNMLLGREDINPDKPDNDGQTPLFGAAYNGHEGVVKILLERDDISPGKPDNDDRTPLWWAACRGHEGVVKRLLERDINPDKPDNDGQTPLFGAAYNGHEGVVKILLERDDINPDKPDNLGQTPLWWASWGGHEGVVKMLLERDGVRPDKLDNDGRTLLFGAAYNGHEGVVKILLERGDVDPERSGNDGQTPLWWASWGGHEEVVKILLKRDVVNPDKPDIKGRTPLWRAACSGHEGVVKILLERDDVNPDKPNINDRTPLWWAARHGHEGVVKTLLARDDVSPDKPDRYGQTPLFWAIKNGHKGVIALLQPPESAGPSLP